MSITTRIWAKRRREDVKSAMNHRARGCAAAFEASFEAALRVQDAPRAWSAISCLLAMTRLAKASKLKSCASFLAKPL